VSKINPKYRPYSFGKRPLLFLFLFVLIVFLLILTPFVPEIVSGDFEDFCKQHLGENYKAILIAAFVLGTAILAYFTVDLSGFISGSKKQRLEALTIPWSLEKEAYAQAANEDAKQSELDEAIKNLYKLEVEALDEELNLISSRLAKYERENLQGTASNESKSVAYNRLTRDVFKVIDAVEKSLKREGAINAKIKESLLGRYENRLDQKLAGRQPINISKAPSSEGTSKTTSSYFVTLSQEDVQAEIKNIFEEAKGRLLITGNPGAGKTVVMLQLVIALLKEKQSAIPVLLNLATWQSSFYKLEAWLEEILPAEMGVNKTLAKKVLKEIPLILLLDGLDEVKEEDRSSCLEAIGRYGANAKHCFVIATRKQEYIAVSKDAPVFLQIEVEPLQIEQIKEELKRISYKQPEALPLLSAIEEDRQLQEVLKTPFYFNILQLLFAQGARLTDLKALFADTENTEQAIVEFFLDRQLNLEKAEWPKEDTRRWLSFLASRMNQKNIVVFELVDLQYDWSRWSKINKLFSWLIYGFSVSQQFGFIFGLFVWLIGGFLFGCLLNDVLTGLVIGLILAIIITLFIIVSGSLMTGLNKYFYNKESNPKIYTKDNTDYTYSTFLSAMRKTAFMSLVAGTLATIMTAMLMELYSNEDSIYQLINGVGSLGVGIIVTILAGFMYSMLYVLTHHYSTLIQINKPYQRFKASAKSLHFSISQHWHLRYLIYKKGLLPWKLVPFLNILSQNHLLETDGATWRFRHRILQDYFADLWEREYAEEYEEEGKKA